MRLRSTGRLPLEGMPSVRRIVQSYATLTRLISWSSPGRLKDRLRPTRVTIAHRSTPVLPAPLLPPTPAILSLILNAAALAAVSLTFLGSSLGGVGPVRGLRGGGRGGGVMSGPGAARTILLFHTISARPPKQPRMVRTFLKVHTRPRLAYALRCSGY